MKDASGVENGTLFHLKRGMVDLPSILQAVEQYCREVAKKKPLTVEFKPYASGLPPYFWGEADRIFQFLWNVVDNALKYTSEGFVRLSTSFTKKENVYNVTIQVEDSGKGMNNKEFLVLLGLQPFSKTTIVFCQQLIQLMGGSITGSTAEGKGSVFQLYFPLEEIQFNNKSALVINCGLEFITFLKNLHIQIEITNSLQEAKIKAETHKFNIVFVNLDLLNDANVNAKLEILAHIRSLTQITAGISSTMNQPLSNPNLKLDTIVDHVFHPSGSRSKIVEILASLK